MQRLALLFERGLRRHVVQQHGRAVDHAVHAADGNRVQIDRDVPTLSAHDAHAAKPLHAGVNCVGHRAVFVGHAPFAAVAHVHQARQQRAAARRGAADAGEPFDARVPQQDFGLAIDEHDAVVHVVDQFLLEQRCAGFGGPLGALGPLVFDYVPRHAAAFIRQSVQPAAGQLIGQQVLILRKQRLELPDQLRVELIAGELEQLGQRPLARASRAIELVGGHRVERIDDRQHPGSERQVVAVAFLVSAVAIEPRAAVVNDFQQVLRRAATGQHFGRECRVPRHERHFFGRQPARA